MQLLIATSLCVLTLLLFTPTVSTLQKFDLSKFKLAVHEYSGLDEKEFWSFMTEMRMFENTLETSTNQAAGHLYEALTHAQNLGMLASSAQQERMHEIARGLGAAGEKVIKESAKRTKTPFKTIYLKDTL